MANAMYAKGREGFLDGSIDYDTDDIRHVLTDEGAAAFDSTDDNLDDLSAGTIATSGAYASKTKTDGTADAADVTHTAVSGASVEAINVYKHTGTASTSRVICNIDTGTGLPVTPNGGDITVQWNASGIFTL
jgi:hypothetical protein